MRTASRFVEALKKSVRARGLTYAELARRLSLSEASVKRMFSRGTFTLARIEEVLAAVDLDLYDVARLSRGAAAGAGGRTHDAGPGGGGGARRRGGGRRGRAHARAGGGPCEGRAPARHVLAGAQRLDLRRDR